MVQRSDDDQAGHVGQRAVFLFGERLEVDQLLREEAHCNGLGGFNPVWGAFAWHLLVLKRQLLLCVSGSMGTHEIT